MRASTLAVLLSLTCTVNAQDDMPQTVATKTGTVQLTSFDAPDEATVAERWYAINDGVMGGRSRGTFDIEQGLLVFRGSLNTNGGGFASIRIDRDKLDLDGVKLSDYQGVHLRVRGDGRHPDLWGT